jgi:hypothetical protein
MQLLKISMTTRDKYIREGSGNDGNGHRTPLMHESP